MSPNVSPRHPPYKRGRCGPDEETVVARRDSVSSLVKVLVTAKTGKSMTKRLLCLTGLLCMIAIPLRGSPIGAVEVQGSRYDAARQVVTLDLLNSSHKEISAYSLLVRVIRTDGTASAWEYGGDFLPFMSENNGNGTFKPGALLAVDVPVGQQQIQSTSASVDVVVYADGTADVLDQEMFATIISKRKGAMLGLQKANELLTTALADPNDPHPSLTAVEKIKALAKEYQIHPPTGAEFEAAGLLDATTNISNAPRSPAGRSKKEDAYLKALVKRHQDRISVMLPHTQLTKGGATVKFRIFSIAGCPRFAF
jgi:hypothetical protein